MFFEKISSLRVSFEDPPLQVQESTLGEVGKKEIFWNLLPTLSEISEDQMPNSTIITNVQKVESKPNKSLGTKYELMITMVGSIFIIQILNKHMDDLQDDPNPTP